MQKHLTYTDEKASERVSSRKPITNGDQSADSSCETEHRQENKWNFFYSSQETRGQNIILGFLSPDNMSKFPHSWCLTSRQAPSGPHCWEFLKLFPSRRYPYTSRHQWTQRPRRGDVMNHPDLSVAEVLEEMQRRPGNVCSAGRKEYFGFASFLPFIAFLLALMPPNLPKVIFLITWLGSSLQENWRFNIAFLSAESSEPLLCLKLYSFPLRLPADARINFFTR